MNDTTRKQLEAMAENHKWSIDCTCATDPYGNCWYHLDDTEKARSSFLAGAEAALELVDESELVEALEDVDHCLGYAPDHCGESYEFVLGVTRELQERARQALAKYRAKGE